MKKYLIAATAASLLAATAISHAQTANTNANNGKMQATENATNNTNNNKMQSPDANKMPATGSSATQASPNTSAQMKTPSASGANTTGMQTGTMAGITMGKTPSGAIRYGQANTGDLMTSKLIGVDV